GGADRRDQRADRGRWIDDAVVSSSIVVLDLLDRDEVRGLHVVYDQCSERVELRRTVARIEVLHVERRDRELVHGRKRRRLLCKETRDARGSLGQLDHEETEVVVDDPGNESSEVIADVEAG